MLGNYVNSQATAGVLWANWVRKRQYITLYVKNSLIFCNKHRRRWWYNDKINNTGSDSLLKKALKTRKS